MNDRTRTCLDNLLSLWDLGFKWGNLDSSYLAVLSVLSVSCPRADWLFASPECPQVILRRELRTHVLTCDWCIDSGKRYYWIERVKPKVTGWRWGRDAAGREGLAGAKLWGATRVRDVSVWLTTFPGLMFEVTGLPKQWCPVTSLIYFRLLIYEWCRRQIAAVGR